MIVKLDRFMRPSTSAADVTMMGDEPTSLKQFIEDRIIGDMYPYIIVALVTVGALLLLQLASTAMLTFLMWYLLVTIDI